MKPSLFYSKILLFGEYGIIEDSKGLSIPYHFYNGLLKLPEDAAPHAEESARSLIEFFRYLEGLPPADTDFINIDMDAFKADLEKGMYFDSSIPKGYGIGSSGALVAAIYDKYGRDKISAWEDALNREALIRLKSVFALMESHFHGTSSGIDPLNSYLKLPILISDKCPEIIGIPQSKEQSAGGAIFLLDSGVEGKTAPMLNVFFENMTQQAFRKMLKTEFIRHTESCIDRFLSGDVKSLFVELKKLSKVALRHFKPMIPENFHKLWAQGIKSNDYYLKLCGSGGGGYILGFTQDIEKTKEILKNHRIEVVYNF